MAFKVETLENRMKALTFPVAPVKVRVSIAGLAFCQLNSGVSRINFLRHKADHDLSLTVIWRRRAAGTHERIDRYSSIRVLPTPLSVSVNDPVPLVSYITRGPHRLQDMVNLNELHGRNLEYAPGEPTYARTKLLLHDCAFYTLFLYDRLVLVESGATNGQELQIGYVLGGNIASRTRTSSTTLLCEEILPIDRVLPGEDGTGNEWVYDLIFNNHCTDPGRCQAQVADPVDTDGDGDTDTVVAGTDFRFYYDFFKEKGSERRFDLKIPSRAGPGPSGADPGDADRGEEAGSVDVAACNPVVTDPPEW